jgi:hypothetical protein
MKYLFSKKLSTLLFKKKFLFKLKNYFTTTIKMSEKEKDPLKQSPDETIFAKFARGEFKPKIVYEDKRAMVFEDINPVAKIHLLIISKTLSIGKIHELENEEQEAELGHLLFIAGILNI